MRTYYVELSITYYDSDEESEFNTSFILTARNSISAVKKITNKGIELLKEETGYYENITAFNIYNFYETTDDARL